MGRKRPDRRGTREPLIKIKFFVEGISEKFYFRELLKDKEYKLHLDIDNINGGGYFSFIRNMADSYIAI